MLEVHGEEVGRAAGLQLAGGEPERRGASSRRDLQQRLGKPLWPALARVEHGPPSLHEPQVSLELTRLIEQVDAHLAVGPQGEGRTGLVQRIGADDTVREVPLRRGARAYPRA